MDARTLAVTPYELSVEGVPVVVYDTPGLDDARIDVEEEDKYLEIMKSLLVRNKIHLVIYCFKVTENRIRRSLIRTFKAYERLVFNGINLLLPSLFLTKKKTLARFLSCRKP